MGKRKSKPKKKTKAQKMATARIKAGKTISQVKAANKKSMQDKAKERNKKFKQTKVQTFGGKKTSFTSKEKTRIKDAGYKVQGYSKAPFKPTPKPAPKPTPKYKSRAEGLADNRKRIEASKPKPTPKVDPIDGTEIAQTRFKSVPAGGPAGDNMSTKFFREGMLPGLRDVVPGESLQNTLKRIANQDKLAVADADTTGLGISPSTVNAFKIKSPTTYGAPSQEAVDKAAGITAGGLNIGGSGFTPDKQGGTTSRVIKPTGNPDVMSPDGTFNRPGPGGPEPEADYTSYQPGSFYNQSDTNMNPTNFLRSTRNVVTTPFRMLGINNGLTNMLIPKSNEAIQDARDQRGPRPTPTRRRRGGGGARIPVAPLTPEEILLPEETAVAQAAPAYQQAQTGVDPNRLMQIQQEAYLQAFNPEYNPMFRFFNRRGGPRRGAFRRAFRRRD